ncbi:MAG: DUF2961 domain-containing protein [Bacteroidota bacterium]|nr:DUF2961 domain-containing protein [Bacteroidota bacterium]
MKITFALFLLVITKIAEAQQLYEMPKNVESRVSSFENPNGLKGNGGRTNKGAKGNAFEWIKEGETKTLLDINGQGIIQRIWLTVNQNPIMLRSLRLKMFWDGEPRTSVDVPMGDFFVYNLGKGIPFQSAFFSSGEGRSFNCYIPMPFRKSAKITLTNEGKEICKLYYDIDVLMSKLPDDALYFHAFWSKQTATELGKDFEILPKVNGKGRFLGMSAGLNVDSVYGKTWWGEGEIKMYIDSDTKYPSINGTGAEDYLGSAWGLGKFINLYQGCTIASDSSRQYNFYRWHVPDAIYFNKDIRVALQQIGGSGTKEVQELFKKGVKLQAISIDRTEGFVRLLDMEKSPSLSDENFPEGWVNFYRLDDYSAVSYFYLDKPTNNLPALPSVSVRIKNVK